MTHTSLYQLTLFTSPASEPLSLAEAKLYLRVDGSAEDDLIGMMLIAVRVAAEQYLRRALITQSWKLAYDDYMPAQTPLPLTPVQSVVAVNQVARDGTIVVVDSGNYYLNARKDTLIFEVMPFAHRVEAIFIAGYGNANDVPAPLKQGMLLHLAELYGNRSGSGAIPGTALMLYAPYRIIGI